LARGEGYPAPVEIRQAASSRVDEPATLSPAVPVDSLQAEACRFPDTGE
jgi:hypothetical protein